LAEESIDPRTAHSGQNVELAREAERPL